MRNVTRNLTIALLLCLPLMACSNDKSASGAAQGQKEEPGLIGQAVRQATDKAREELAKNDIDLHADGQPKAAITPQGELVIDGKPVALDAKQHALVQDYRARITDIAEAGIEIGVQGADLAGKAVGEALASVFSGDKDGMEKRIEHHAEGIKDSALKLCTKMPAMLEAQNRLADAVPEFKPYASMTQKDVEDCNKDGNINVNLPGINVNHGFDGDTASGSEGSPGGDAAAEAEAAAIDAKH